MSEIEEEYINLENFIFYGKVEKNSGKLIEYKVPAELENDFMLTVITKQFLTEISPELRAEIYQKNAN